MARTYRGVAQVVAVLGAMTQELDAGYLPLIQLPQILQNLADFSLISERGFKDYWLPDAQEKD